MDVFAERRFEGNALAVFHDARGLTDAEMQALARETNLSETTFVFPRDPEVERREGVRVRIFTNQEELPFAGHPTLGTATWLYLNHPVFKGAETITLLLNVGEIAVRFERLEEGVAGVRATMTQKDPMFLATHERAEIAELLGLGAEDLSDQYLPQTISTGVPFCVVLLRSLEASRRMQLRAQEAQAWTEKHDAQFFYCIAALDRREGGGADFHARMQFYSGEDPATGSAAGCCIAWLVKSGLVESGAKILIEQGIEILRPSLIGVRAEKDRERVHSVEVSGRTISVAEGRFFLP